MQYLKKLLFSSVLALTLAACAGQTPLDRVTILEEAMTTAETTFLVYAGLPDCDANPPPCSDDEVIAEAGKKDKEAFDAIQDYRNAVLKQEPDGVLDELFLAAQSAIAKFSTATK